MIGDDLLAREGSTAEVFGFEAKVGDKPCEVCGDKERRTLYVDPATGELDDKGTGSWRCRDHVRAVQAARSKPSARVYRMGRKWWVRIFGSIDSFPTPFVTKAEALERAKANELAVKERGVTDADELVAAAAFVEKRKAGKRLDRIATAVDAHLSSLDPSIAPALKVLAGLPPTHEEMQAIGTAAAAEKLEPGAVLEVLEYLNASGTFLPADLLEDGLPEAFVARLTRYVPGKDGKITAKSKPGIYGIDLLRALAAEVGADTSYSSKVYGREVEAEALVGKIREKVAGGK